MIDVGLVGFGFAGRTFHAPVIAAVEGLRLAAILQRVGPEAQLAYPATPVVRTLEQLLAIESIRLVVIATPNTTHFELAKQCLLAGRDVGIEIGRASCRERVQISVVAVSLKKKI